MQQAVRQPMDVLNEAGHSHYNGQEACSHI